MVTPRGKWEYEMREKRFESLVVVSSSPFRERVDTEGREKV